MLKKHKDFYILWFLMALESNDFDSLKVSNGLKGFKVFKDFREGFISPEVLKGLMGIKVLMVSRYLTVSQIVN